MWDYVTAIWNILRQFVMFYGHTYGKMLAIWFIFPHFGIVYREKSGNPAIG
jgi:hypothetical protein